MYVLFFLGFTCPTNQSTTLGFSIAGGHVKYVAKHEVQGRVQLLRLLNPSALFETDAQGNKVELNWDQIGDFWPNQFFLQT